MRCIIIDDEPIARRILKEYMEDIPELNLIGEAENAFEAMKMLKEGSVDLLFLDVEMPKVNGLTLFSSLEKKPMAIITTAHQQFALQGFELDVIDYILKPIGFERFLRSINKAVSRFEKKHIRLNQDSEFIFIKSSNKIEKISYDEIFYIEGFSNYVLIHTKTEKKIVYHTIKGVESSLPSSAFIRIHKSYIVSLDKIAFIEGSNLTLTDGRMISVSVHYKDELDQFVKNHFLKR